MKSRHFKPALFHSPQRAKCLRQSFLELLPIVQGHSILSALDVEKRSISLYKIGHEVHLVVPFNYVPVESKFYKKKKKNTSLLKSSEFPLRRQDDPNEGVVWSASHVDFLRVNEISYSIQLPHSRSATLQARRVKNRQIVIYNFRLVLWTQFTQNKGNGGKIFSPSKRKCLVFETPG